MKAFKRLICIMLCLAMVFTCMGFSYAATGKGYTSLTEYVIGVPVHETATSNIGSDNRYPSYTVTKIDNNGPYGTYKIVMDKDSGCDKDMYIPWLYDGTNNTLAGFGSEYYTAEEMKQGVTVTSTTYQQQWIKDLENSRVDIHTERNANAEYLRTIYPNPKVRLMEDVYDAEDLADLMYMSGMFKGTGINKDGTPIYSLEKVATRVEALTMLLRMLGKEEQAEEAQLAAPFTDVPDWAKYYVGYAYYNGITMGTSATTFSSDDKVTAQQYATFCMRALGYEDKTDFTYDTAITDFNKIKGTHYTAEPKTFLRSDMVKMSANTLMLEKKGTGIALIKVLEKGFVTKMRMYAPDYGSVSWETIGIHKYGETNVPLKDSYYLYSFSNPSGLNTKYKLLSYMQDSYISRLSRAKASGYHTYFTLKNCMHSSVKIQEDRTFDQWVIIGDEEYAMYAGVCTDLYSLLLTLTPGTENDDYIDFDMMFFDISEYTVK